MPRDQVPRKGLERALSAVRRGTSPRKLESQTLDFKTASSSARETLANLAEAAVCLANSIDGTLVLGVADRAAGAEAMVGTDLAANTVRAGTFERTVPHLDNVVEELDNAGVRLVVVTPRG